MQAEQVLIYSLFGIVFFFIFFLNKQKPFDTLLDMVVDKKKMDHDLIKATKVIIKAYQELLLDEKTVLKYPEYTKEYLLSFCEKALEEKMTVDKLSRWLGFLQGVLIVNGVIDQEQERDRTRVIFQDIYQRPTI